jgi:hypothetical protein
MNDLSISRQPPGKASVGQRIAGLLLILNAALLLVEAGLSPLLPDTGGPRSSMFLGSALLDVVIGVSLLLGHRKLALLGVVRSALGVAVFGVLYVKTAPLAAVFQALASTGLLLLLIGNARTARMVIGSVIFGIYLMMASLSLVFVATGQLPIAALLLRATGAISPLASPRITGTTVPYVLTAPEHGWYLRKEALAKKHNPLSDRWLTRPDTDAHLMILAEHVPGAIVPMEAYTDEVIQNAKKASQRFTVKSREVIASNPEHGRIVRATATVKELELEYVFGVFAAYDRGFQLVGFGPAKSFSKVSREMEAMIASFELPPEVLNPPPPKEVETLAAGHVLGVSFPYSLDAPNDHWHLRKAEVVRTENPLIDRWLVRYDRDAHVFVVAEHVPGTNLPIDAYTDAVLQNLRERSKDLVMVSREPMAIDSHHARLMHLKATVEGKPIEYLFATYVAPERGFQVAGFAAASLFASVESELRQTVESFRLPPPAARK